MLFHSTHEKSGIIMQWNYIYMLKQSRIWPKCDMIHTLGLLILVLKLEYTASSNKTPQCLTSCYSVPNGYYQSCQGCDYFSTCYHGQLAISYCGQGKQWNDEKKSCSLRPSPTCDGLNSTSDVRFDIVHSSGNDNSHEEDSDEEITIQKKCQDAAYVLVPAGIGFGILQILICGLCLLWKMNWYKDKEVPLDKVCDVVTTATQTVDTVEGHTYQELTPADTRSNDLPRYMIMPYAVSSQHGYVEIQQPPYEEPLHTENQYVELYGYDYLQKQNTDTREKVERMLSPLIETLCQDGGLESSQYAAVTETINKLSQELQQRPHV